MTESTQGPKHCWECGAKLMTAKGGGYIFAVVMDAGGYEHRVHKECKDDPKYAAEKQQERWEIKDRK